MYAKQLLRTCRERVRVPVRRPDDDLSVVGRHGESSCLVRLGSAWLGEVAHLDTGDLLAVALAQPRDGVQSRAREPVLCPSIVSSWSTKGRSRGSRDKMICADADLPPRKVVPLRTERARYPSLRALALIDIPCAPLACWRSTDWRRGRRAGERGEGEVALALGVVVHAPEVAQGRGVG